MKSIKALTIASLLFISMSQNAFAAYCAVPQANFCPANRFENGDFEIVTGDPDAVIDEDIDLATGWSKITSSGDFADIYCPATVSHNIGGSSPSPQSGVYSSAWISNNYREGMFNKLKTPIAAGNVAYNFRFKTAKMLVDNAAKIGIYGVKYDPSTPLPLAMTGPTLNLFGAGNMVLLAEVNVPANAGRTWVSQTVSFNSNQFGTMNQITHILIAKVDGASVAGSYMAFDDFCMRTKAEDDPRIIIEIGDPIDIGTIDIDIPNPSASTCCPPLAGTKQLASLFNQTASTVTGSYKIELDTASTQYAEFVQGYQAYLNLLKLNCKSVRTLDVVFTLHNASAIGGSLDAKLGEFKVSFPSGNITPVLPQFNVALQPNQAYGVKATTVGVDARGNVVNCGFDATQCSSDDRFTFDRNVGARKAGAGKNSKNSKDGLTIGK